jgi:hypothetical protein
VPPAFSIPLDHPRQAGELTKEQEAKLLKIDFVFDAKQAQIVRDEYLAGRLSQLHADSSLSAQHSDDEDGESDQDAETTFDMSTVDIEAQFKELKALERKQQAERKRKLLSLSWGSPGGKDDMGGSSSGAARGAAGGAATQRAIANRGSNKKPKQASEGGPKKKARDDTGVWAALPHVNLLHSGLLARGPGTPDKPECGFLGVRWNRKKNKWRVRMKANGKVGCHFCNSCAVSGASSRACAANAETAASARSLTLLLSRALLLWARDCAKMTLPSWQQGTTSP